MILSLLKGLTKSVTKTVLSSIFTDTYRWLKRIASNKT